MTTPAITVVIPEFQGPYRFLSNFWPHPVLYKGVLYPTNEHAYQSDKTDDPKAKELIAKAPRPGDAKRLGKQVPLKLGWNVYHRYSTMEALVALKFAPGGDLGMQLADTADAMLIEGNRWCDQTWGDCTCAKHADRPGHNLLGWMLMRHRTVLHDLRQDWGH